MDDDVPGAAEPAEAGPEVVVVVVTTPDETIADGLAMQLVAGHLAACVQVGGPVRSTYRWEGAIETDHEWTVTAKTSTERLTELVSRIRELHPYDVPEVVATPAVGGSRDYLEWVLAESRPPGDAHPTG